MIEVILTAIKSQLLNNDMLVAGIGTIVSGSILYLFKSVPSKLYNAFIRWRTLAVTMTTRHASTMRALDAVLYEHRIEWMNRVFTFNTGRRYDEDYSTGISYGYGTQWIFYKGKLARMSKNRIQNVNEVEEEMEVVIFTRDKQIIKDLYQEVRAFLDERNKDKTEVFVGRNGSFQEVDKFPKRKLETVFINGETKKVLVDRIKWFIENEQWYNDRGIPYKLCFLFHGLPGSGKTSLIKALVGEIDYKIGFISSFHNLSNLVQSDEFSKMAYVIEDIDTISGNLKREEETDVISDGSEGSQQQAQSSVLHELLNTLDGMRCKHGSIFFITTNHINKLDAAILRKGRVDHIVEIGKCDYDTMLGMYRAFYGIDLDIAKLPKTKYNEKTGAELQDLFLHHDKDFVIKFLKRK